MGWEQCQTETDFLSLARRKAVENMEKHHVAAAAANASQATTPLQTTSLKWKKCNLGKIKWNLEKN